MNVFALHVCLCSTCVPGTHKGQKKESDSPRSGTTDLWEQPCGSWERNLGSLQAQLGLLTA